MYKFLISMPDAINSNDQWFYSYNSKMYPTFSHRVKEAILVGYHSRAQEKWITSGTSIHLVEDYYKVRKAFPDTEMCLIVLGNDLTGSDDDAYLNFYSHLAEEYI